MSFGDHELEYVGKRVTVVGLGLFGGGAAVVKYFHSGGAAVTVTDTRSEAELAPSLAELADMKGVTYVLGRHRRQDIVSADLVVINPAVPESADPVLWARRAGVPIEREINIVMKKLSGLTIGVTGSNGKSTTTALLGDMMRRQFPGTLLGGNIGVSLLPSLETAHREIPAVLELSSFQLKGLAETKISPNIAVVVNLTPNHIDWHGDFQDYAQSKFNILRFQSTRDTAVLNADDPHIKVWRYSARGRSQMYSTQRPIDDNGAYTLDGAIYIVSHGVKRRLCGVDKIALPGGHNLSNALAAVCAATSAGVSDANIVRSLTRFTGLPHRLECVAETAAGVRYVNDSIATTPESVIAAVSAFTAPITLIAGGYDKKIPFDGMARAIADSSVKNVLLIGRTAGAIATALTEAGFSGRMKIAERLENAMQIADAITPTGGVVLMSPGCASYDQFQNFTDRGETFRVLTAEILQKHSVPSLVRTASVA